MSTRYWMFGFLALGCLAFLGELQGWLLEAGTISGGSAVTLSGVDSFANTVQGYAKGNLGKMVGILTAVGGIAAMGFGKTYLGMTGLGSGIGIAFVPNIIGDAFDSTAAAPLTGVAPLVPLVAGEGILNLLAQAGLVFLWPLVPVLKYGSDPVVWLALGVVVALRPTFVYRHARLLALAAKTAGMRYLAAETWCRVG